MSSTDTDPTIVLETGGSGCLYAVAFHPDGKHLFGGGKDGVRRWRLADGQEVGKQTGMSDFNAISVSKDHRWVVCGTDEGASVWDAEMHKKAIDVEGTNWVYAVDVSPDSTRFATATEGEASIWSITSGERLVGPLEHDEPVTGIAYSPNGEHVATSGHGGLVRIFQSHSGDEVITIKTITPTTRPNIPLAWSNDAQQIFATSNDKKIRSFAVSTGSQIAESPILAGDHKSIALAPNGRFIATNAGSSISFLDTSTLSLIVPAIEDGRHILSIAISPDGSYLATGRDDGKITVRNLGGILPDSYCPFHTSTREDGQPDTQPSTSGGYENKAPDSKQEEPGKSSLLKSKTHNEADCDLLEVEVPTNMLAVQFDYGESLSPVSIHSHVDEILPRGTSPAVPQPSDPLPVAPSPKMCPEEHCDIVESSRGIPMFKRSLLTWIRKGNRDPALHEPGRVPRKLCQAQAADHQSCSQLPARVEDSHVGPSRMAANKRVPRMVATSFKVPQPDAKRTYPKKRGSRTRQGAADAAEADLAQQADDPSRPSSGRIRVTDQRTSGDAVISIRLPAWMLCRGSANEDGTHG